MLLLKLGMRGRSSMKKIFSIIGTVVIIIIIISFLWGHKSDKYIDIVKNGNLQKYPGVTINQAVKGFFGSPEWENNGEKDGFVYVTVSGKMMYMEKEVNAALQFKIDKENNSFEVYALEFNGVPQNLLMKATLIEKMFGDSKAAITESESSGNQDNDNYNYGDREEPNKEITKEEYLALLNYYSSGENMMDLQKLTRAVMANDYYASKEIADQIISKNETIYNIDVPEGFGIQDAVEGMKSEILYTQNTVEEVLNLLKDNDRSYFNYFQDMNGSDLHQKAVVLQILVQNRWH